VLLIAMVVLGAACGSGASSVGGGSGSPSASGPATSTPGSPSPSPLVVPKGCSPDGSAPEISAINTTWVDPDGHPLDPGEACLAVPRGPFTLTLHNDPHAEGIGTPNHNFSVYTDSSATEALFTGDIAYPGTNEAYHVPGLPAGTYLFHCDIHPQTMVGVLVVK
jgi:hypothetical protein